MSTEKDTTNKNADDAKLLRFQFVGNLDNLEQFVDVLAEELDGVYLDIYTDEDGDSFEFVLQDNSILTVDIPESLKNPENLKSYFHQMASFYSQIDTAHKDIQEKLVKHLTCCNAVVSVCFTSDEDEKRLIYLSRSIYDAVDELDGYIIKNNRNIVNGEGKLVLSHDGRTDLEEFTPSVPAEHLFSHTEEESEQDKKRAAKSIQTLKEMNIPHMEKMRLALREGDVKLKPVRDIVERAISLFTVALFAEGVLTEDVEMQTNLDNLNDLNEQFGVISYLNQDELIFTNTEEFDRQYAISFVWKYECCELLLWALGIIDKINKPNKICDVRALVRAVMQFKNIDEMIAAVNMRSTEELHQEQDLMMRYHWACIEANLKGEQLQALDYSLVRERHLSLNWLLTDLFGEEWDEVETPA